MVHLGIGARGGWNLAGRRTGMDISAGIAGCTAVAGSHSSRVHGSKTCSAAGNNATACSAEMSPGNCPLTRFNRSLATRWILELRVSIGEVRGETAARRTMFSMDFGTVGSCEVRTRCSGDLSALEKAANFRDGKDLLGGKAKESQRRLITRLL